MNEGQRQFKHSTLFTLMLIISVVVIVTAILFTVFLIQSRTKGIITQADSQLLIAAEFQREILGPGYHDLIVDKNSIPKEHFRQIVARNDDLCRRLNLQYLWSVLLVDGRLVFTSATHSNPNDSNSPCASFFETHRDPESFAPALSPEGKISFSSFKNEWGQGRQVLVPRKDARGRIYIFGASIQLTSLHAMIRETILTSIGIALIIIIGAFLLAIVLARSFTLSVARLTEAAELMATGNLDVPLTPSGTSELQSLAKSIDQMRQGIQHHLSALLESEEKYRTLVVNANESIIVAQDGLLKFVNPRTLILLGGYSEQEVMGRPFPEFIHPDDRSMVVENYRHRNAKLEVPSRYTFRVITRDGSVRWVEISATLIEWQGKPATLNFLTDITERRMAEENLRAYQNMLNQILNTVPQSIFWKDKTGAYLGCNQVFAKAAGMDDPDQIIGKTDFDLPWPRIEAEAYRADDAQVIISGAPKMHIMEPLLQADGVRLWIDTSKMPLLDTNHEIHGVLGVYEDITERKRMEEALQESESKLRAVLDSTPFPVALVDVEDNIIDFWSRSALTLFGHTAPTTDEWYQIAYPDPDYRRDVIDRWKPFLETARESCQTVNTGEYRVTCSDGSVRICELYTTFLADRLIVTFSDITDRKRAEEEKQALEERLQRSEKMEALGLLAGGVAHDLNNVLGIVVGYAEMVLGDIDEKNPIREDLQSIMEGGHKAAAIVQDLLTLARRGVTGRKVINVNRLILDFNKSPEWENINANHPYAQIKTELETDLLNISASPVHIQKTLMNLVSNASEAMPQGGKITIKTSNQYLDKPISGYDNIREGDYVVVSVSDTGEGISESDMKRIFEPFYTKKIMGRSGTGLGLAVVWGTVKDHQGYIDVQSKEGKGTTFTIYFPVTREDITAETASLAMSEYMGKGESILIVDDVKKQRDLATAMLKKLNYTVTSVSSGEEAIEYLKQNKADIIVLDMIMDPGMDGLDTYKKVIEIHPKQKAIIVSGFSESDRVHDAQVLGAGEYIKKPYVQEKLGMAVKKELDKK